MPPHWPYSGTVPVAVEDAEDDVVVEVLVVVVDDLVEVVVVEVLVVLVVLVVFVVVLPLEPPVILKTA